MIPGVEQSVVHLLWQPCGPFRCLCASEAIGQILPLSKFEFQISTEDTEEDKRIGSVHMSLCDGKIAFFIKQSS